MAFIYRRGKTFWVGWYAHGKKHFRSLKTRDKRVALFKKAQHEQDLIRGRGSEPAISLTFSEACQLYQEFSKTRKAASTLKIDSWMFRKLEDILGSSKLSALRPVQIETTLDQLAKERDLHPTTRNHYLKLLRSMGNWLVEQGHLFENPTRGIQRIKVAKAPRIWLSRKQRDQLLALAKSQDSRHYPMIAMACFAGLRREELLTLEWPDVDFQGNLIRIQPKPHTGWAPKSRKARIVPLHPRLRAILMPIAGKQGVCFPAPSGGRYRSKPRPRVLIRLFEQVGLKDQKRLGWHTLRHTWFTLLLLEGVPIRKAMDWGGHEDMKTTMIYSHMVPGYDADIGKI